MDDAIFCAQKEGVSVPRKPSNDEEALRAAYPPEQAHSAVSQDAEEEWAAYPDMVYRAQARNTAAAGGVGSSWAAGGTPHREKQTALWAFVALLCGMVLCLLGYAVASLYQAYIPFRQRVAVVNRDTFAQGVMVDGVSIGGMTRAQAEAALEGGDGWSGSSMRLTVRVDDQTYLITNRELPLQRNLKSVLDTAYAVGRQGSPDTIGTDVTPFEYRYAHLHHTASQPVSLNTQVTYDPAAVRGLVESIREQVSREAQDALVATFDFSSRTFTFTQDQPGARLDADALYRQIIDALERRDYAASIAVSTEAILPQVTRVELMNSFALVSSYTTQTTGDANRNNNIHLACQAISRIVVMPGETFSFNEATGQRTTDKGYLPAPAIAGGATVDEVGGGVCQVSSTLFNAAAMADLTILSRSPHTWPSNYVEKGRDATVNWPGLDFSFRNDKATPIFIVAYYQQRQCTVELYGASLGAGVSIDLATRVVSATEPPAEPLYEFNPALPPGTVQEKKKARTGYVVETYKVYKRGGAEIRRELLCTSRYQMIQQVLEYNQ